MLKHTRWNRWEAAVILIATVWLTGNNTLEAAQPDVQQQARRIVARIGAARGICVLVSPEAADLAVEMAGQSENNLRRIFATARRNAPSLIFFDEFDSLVSQRSTYSDGGARANNAVVAQFLTELDGFLGHPVNDTGAFILPDSFRPGLSHLEQSFRTISTHSGGYNAHCIGTGILCGGFK